MFTDLFELRDLLVAFKTDLAAKQIGKAVADVGKSLVIIGNTVDLFDGGDGPTTMALSEAEEAKMGDLLVELEGHALSLMPTAALVEGDVTTMPPGLAGLDLTGLDPSTIALILQLLQTFGPIIMDFVKRLIARRQQRRG